MGILPSSQLGSIATVNISNSNNVFVSLSGQAGGLVGTVASNSYVVSLTNSQPLTPGVAPRVVALTSGLSSTFDILSFRIANAIQRMREIQQCAGQGYKEQLEARWNVKLSTALSDHCTYIGGNSSQINISSALGPLLDAAAMFTVAGKLGKSVNMFKHKYGKIPKYSFEK
jgi:hypothetical protein